MSNKSIRYSDEFKQQMSDAQLKAGVALCAKLLKGHSLTTKDIKRHKDLTATACPGKNFRIVELIQFLTVRQDTGPVDNVIYTVQVGAFKNKKYAERLMQKLESLGYKDVFIDNKHI